MSDENKSSENLSKYDALRNLQPQLGSGIDLTKRLSLGLSAMYTKLGAESNKESFPVAMGTSVSFAKSESGAGVLYSMPLDKNLYDDMTTSSFHGGNIQSPFDADTDLVSDYDIPQILKDNKITQLDKTVYFRS